MLGLLLSGVAAYQLGTKRPGNLVGVCPGAAVAGKGEPFIGTFIQKIQDSGAKWFRYGIGMDGISKCSGGCYNWDGWTPWITSAIQHGLTVLGTIGWPAPWACVNGLPDIGAMADYSRQTVAHYKNVIHHWEIFNEVNFKFNYCGSDNPAHYAQLLKACYTAIKQEDPTATVIVSGLAYPNPGDGTEPISFLRILYQQGAKNYMDAMNIHPYTYSLPPMSPESWNGFSHLPDLRAVMTQNGDAAKKIWITEIGQSVCTHPTECVNADTQAQYLVWTLGNASTVYNDFLGPVIWYEWYDQGTDYNDRESVYGIYDVYGNPRPAAYAFASSIGSPAPAPSPPAPSPAPSGLTDLGAGCCYPGTRLFNAANINCANDCIADPSCKTAVYGWADGLNWCMTFDTVCSSTLASGPTDCGSSGNNGVHTYIKSATSTPPPTMPSVTLRDIGAGCCNSLGAPATNGANVNCAADCLANTNCQTAVFGWNDGYNWCMTYTGVCTPPLGNGPTDCGSSGNNGVHTYVRTQTTAPPTPPSPIPPTLVDRGAGCDQASTGDIFNAPNPNCLADCLANSNCKCAIFGWANSQWCRLSSTSCTGMLSAGPTDCGSAGNTGVHTYVRSLTSFSSVNMVNKGPGCPAYLTLDLFNAPNPNCLADCVANPQCQTATYGWANSQWCSHFTGAFAPPLLAGPTDCGSSGNNGVHTFSKVTSVQTMAGAQLPVMMVAVSANETFASDKDPVWIGSLSSTSGALAGAAVSATSLFFLTAASFFLF